MFVLLKCVLFVATSKFLRNGRDERMKEMAPAPAGIFQICILLHSVTDDGRPKRDIILTAAL